MAFVLCQPHVHPSYVSGLRRRWLPSCPCPSHSSNMWTMNGRPMVIPVNFPARAIMPCVVPESASSHHQRHQHHRLHRRLPAHHHLHPHPLRFRLTILARSRARCVSVGQRTRAPHRRVVGGLVSLGLTAIVVGQMQAAAASWASVGAATTV